MYSGAIAYACTFPSELGRDARDRELTTEHPSHYSETRDRRQHDSDQGTGLQCPDVKDHLGIFESGTPTHCSLHYIAHVDRRARLCS